MGSGLGWLKQWAKTRYWSSELEDFLRARPELEVEIIVQGPVKYDRSYDVTGMTAGERMFPDAKVLVNFRASWSAARRKYVLRFMEMEKNVRYI